MTKQQVVNIPIDQIVNKFDVRVQLDDDTVLHLAELYNAGEQLPPVEVIKTGESEYAFVDGRHRAAARAFLGMTDVPAIVGSENGHAPMPLFAQALKANWGGAKQPTRADIQHTVVRMMESGANETTLRKLLAFIPVSLVRRYISDAKATISKRGMLRALEAVASGKSVSAAAKEQGISQEALSDVIAGRKRKWGSNTAGAILADNKGKITRILRSANSTIGQQVNKLIQEVADGDLPHDVAEQVIKAWEVNIKGTLHRIGDWRQRLAAVSVTDTEEGQQ